MKKTLFLSIVVLVIALILALGCNPGTPAPTTPAPKPTSTPAPAPTTTIAPTTPAPTATATTTAKVSQLRLSVFQTPSSSIYKNAWLPFAADLEKRTGGRVQVTIYHTNTLIPAAQAYDGVAKGIADIAYVVPANTPGRFPLSSYLVLPFMGTSSSAATRIAKEMYDKYPEIRAEFKDVHFLFHWQTEPFAISTTKKPVRNLDDLKGMKIGGAGSIIQILKTLGAAPSVVGAADRYGSLQTGIIDGVSMGWTGIASLNLQEVTKYHTDAKLLTGDSITVMNINSWEKLPADIQKILTDLAAETQQKMVTDTQDQESVVKNLIKSSSGEVITLTAEELDKWVATVAPIWDAWKTEMDAKNLPGSKVLSDASALMKKYR